MFSRKILISIIAVVFSFIGWKNKNLIYDAPQIQSENFAVSEVFNKGVKSSYKSGNVVLSTGEWFFDSALIGDLPTDKKTGLRAARIKSGSISMNFDIYDVKKILINHAVFGKDTDADIEILISADQGKTYKRIGEIFKSSNSLKLDSAINPVKEKIRLKILSSSPSRINISDIIFKGVGDSRVLVDNEITVYTKPVEQVSNTLTSRKSIRGQDAPPEIGENSNMYFGNPSKASFADPNNYLIDHYYYILSYNRSKGTPNWVSWHLDKSNITSNTGRINNFAAYSGLPQGWYQVQSNSYAESGFDRGHNCPSGDRTSSRNANLSTFLMTNMIPQAPQNNQKPWADFEVYLREQVKKGNEVYIIMGVYGEGGSGSKGNMTVSIDSGRVVVPSNIWKVALILPEGDNDKVRAETQEAKYIAINTPNKNVLSTDWRKYIVSIRDIELATGYNLFSVLSKKVQNDIENRKAVNL